MAINSGISWCDHTVNFWTGCKKVSPGCKYCYMYRDKERFRVDPTIVMQVAEKTINKVLREAKPGDKLFTCSWSDFFIEEADQWREWAWDIIRKHPQFIWQILTKRPERIKDCLPADWGDGWPQVWLGVSAEDQENANKRIPILLQTPAKFRFVSAEPLIGPINLTALSVDSYSFFQALQPITSCGDSNRGALDWVIIGGESGNVNGKHKFRPAHIDWFKRIVYDCQVNKVAVWVKQTGTHIATEMAYKDRHGSDIEEFPEDLRIRQFPV